MATQHCWLERWEAAGYRSWLDWLLADPARCRIEAENEARGGDVFDPTGGHDTCILPAGHPSPHEFVSPAEILVRFRGR